jgi:hypothetical protein
MAIEIGEVPYLSQGILGQVRLAKERYGLLSSDISLLCFIDGDVYLIKLGLVCG